MSALTANSAVKLLPVDGNLALKPTVSTTFYAGSIVGLNRQTGLAVKWVDASNAGVVFQGIARTKISVDASGNDTTRATQVTGTVPALVPIYPMFDRKAENLPVAGVTADTDHGQWVWCLTDNAAADLTITAPADDRAPVGIIWKYRSSGYADVLFFSPMEAILMTLIGVYGDFIQGFFNAGFGAGVTFAKVVQGISAEFTNVVFRIGTAEVTTGSSFTAQVNVNGGSDIFASADSFAKANFDAKGDVLTSDEAVVSTGNRHIFHDGDTLNVVLVDGGTAPTTARGLIEVRYKRLIGV